MTKKCSRSAVSIEVLALLSNNHENTRCSSRLVVVIYRESVGGKVVGFVSRVFFTVESIQLFASFGINFKIFNRILIKNDINFDRFMKS